MMPPKKKFNSHVGLSFVHLVVGVVVMVVFIEAPQPWRGILFATLLLSLIIWPARFLWNQFKEERGQRDGH